MRRSRVTSLGEPGGRLKPRALSVRATLSMRTAPFVVREASSRTTRTSSSCGAVCASSTWSRSGSWRTGSARRGSAPAAGARPRRRPRRPRRGPLSAAGAARLGSADAAPPSVRAVRRWKVMPSAVATSPTASKARSSETISSTSPGCAPASHTPALTAMRRSLQSRTPVDGALWTSWAPWRASRRAVSWPITRQLPTATNSVLRPRWSMASRSITRSMCAGWLVFSTSKKIACRVVGRRRSGAGGGTRAANTGSGVSTGTRSFTSAAGATVSSVRAGVTSAAGLAFSPPPRRGRLVVIRSMPASYGTEGRPPSF